jgi:ubiquinone biosynthesis protein COQ4
LATIAQLAVVKAYSISAPLIPATLSYCAVVFSSLIGAWLWGDMLGFWDALGIALIVASGVLVSAGQSQAVPSAALPPADQAAEQLKKENRKNNLRALYATFMLGKRPDQVKYVFMMGDAQDNIAEGARTRGEMTDPFAAAPLETMWKERFAAARYDIDALLRLPADTLGGAYARHMKANGLRPDFYKDVAPHHRMHYLRMRMRQTHDVWHVLSGFGTDEFGEVGLQGFYFAQFTNGQSALIASAAMLKSVLRGRFGDLEKHVDAFCEGYCNGKRAERLLEVRWEELWGQCLHTLRRRYRIAEPQCRAGLLELASA